MLIVCPSCASEYTIEPGHIGADGRTVRCAACRTAWFVAPEGRAPETGSAEPGVAEAARDRSIGAEASSTGPAAFAPARKKPRRGGALARKKAGRAPRRVAAALATAAALGALAGAVGGRDAVVRALPETARLYAGIGLPVNLRGLDLRGVTSDLLIEGSGTVLVVEGEVANVRAHAIQVPSMALALRASDGRTLYRWTVDPPRETLSQGEAARFRARLASPPAEAREVLVQFAKASEGWPVAAAQ